MYIPDLPTYLVFYLETTRGSSIDQPTTDDDNDDDDDDEDNEDTFKIFTYPWLLTCLCIVQGLGKIR
jgi:hypothetical protein